MVVTVRELALEDEELPGSEEFLIRRVRSISGNLDGFSPEREQRAAEKTVKVLLSATTLVEVVDKRK